jgi:hypothetical protein
LSRGGAATRGIDTVLDGGGGGGMTHHGGGGGSVLTPSYALAANNTGFGADALPSSSTAGSLIDAPQTPMSGDPPARHDLATAEQRHDSAAPNDGSTTERNDPLTQRELAATRKGDPPAQLELRAVEKKDLLAEHNPSTERKGHPQPEHDPSTPQRADAMSHNESAPSVAQTSSARSDPISREGQARDLDQRPLHPSDGDA